MSTSPSLPPLSGPITEHAAFDEAHIAGILIQARPEHAADVCLAVSLLPKAEVTHQGDDGRIVAVLEAASGRAIAQQTENIRILPGVINVALVYQHAESEEEMAQEMPA
jgi:nitrate reductase NapD